MVAVKSFNMGHGPSMPGIAFGTWQVPKEDAKGLVAEALDVGYRHIDCAHIYANEESIGETFGAYPNRKELFIVSKLWSDSHEPEKVKPAFENTLDNLKCQYLDLYLVHNPARTSTGFESKWFKKEWILETWREMEKLIESDSCKAVGVSNFTTVKLGWLLDEASIKPANNQVELQPYLPQNKLLNFCKENGILVSAYSPLGTPGTAVTFPQFNSPSNPVLLTDPLIGQIAEKNKCTPAQVLLNWGYSRGTPVLCKSSSRSRMVENLASLELTLPQEDIEAINNITTQCRFCSFSPFLCDGHTLDEFWDNETYN